MMFDFVTPYHSRSAAPSKLSPIRTVRLRAFNISTRARKWFESSKMLGGLSKGLIMCIKLANSVWANGSWKGSKLSGHRKVRYCCVVEGLCHITLYPLADAPELFLNPKDVF